MQTDLSLTDVVKKFEDFTAVDEVSFDVERGRFFSILGPSGCGKTTLLRMIAGFIEPTSGTLRIGGRDMARVPPNKRPVNLIFQHLALFPMMNVGENIAFGLRQRGENKRTCARKSEEMLERVGLAGFSEKRIEQLSGGQKQRVAIARSLVLEPTVLLLDEPLGALDLKLREQMKVELKKLQSEVGTTFVYITHDQSEALVMSDYVAVMNNGRFEQVDTPQNLYADPATPFVALFVGENNRWPGRIETAGGNSAGFRTASGTLFRTRVRENMEGGASAELFLRPEAMVIEPPAEDGELNRFPVTVKTILFDGANSRLLVAPDDTDTELTVALPQNRRFDHIRAGDRLTVGWHMDSGICFPGGEG